MDATDVRVTVCIPVFNAEKMLRETVESVLNQTFSNFELLAIDDGSTDSSVSVLESFKDPRIRIICNNQNKGRPFTRNRGIELARAEYLAVLDSDDLCEPTRLERQVQYLDEHTDIVAVGSAATYIDEAGNSAFICNVPTSPEEIRKRIFQWNCFVHSSVTFRRQVLLDMGGYNPDFPQAQDYELFLRLSAHHRLANIPEPLVRYRVHPNQVSLKKLASQRKLADKARMEAYEYQSGLGLLEPGAIRPSTSLSAKLRGQSGTVGSDYLGWIKTYRALGRTDLVGPLAWQALMSAPLSARVWQEIWRILQTVVLPQTHADAGRPVK